MGKVVCTVKVGFVVERKGYQFVVEQNGYQFVVEQNGYQLLKTIFYLWRCDPTQVMASSFLMFPRSHTMMHHSR
jgi:hypothetical protein